MKKPAVRTALALAAAMAAVLVLDLAAVPAAKIYALFSPDKTIEVRVTAGNALTYTVLYKGRPLVAPSAVSMTLDKGVVLGRNAKVKRAKVRPNDTIIKPFVRQKAAEFRNRYNELRLDVQGDYAFIVRAYEDGVAYRFETAFKAPIKVVAEQAEFTFTADHTVYWPQEDGFQTHQERALQAHGVERHRRQEVRLHAGLSRDRGRPQGGRDRGRPGELRRDVPGPLGRLPDEARRRLPGLPGQGGG